MTDHRRLCLLVNASHFLDHYLLLVLPTAAIAMPVWFGASYAERLGLGFGMTLAFGFGHLPFGFLADRVPRVAILRLFLFASAGAALLVALARSPFELAAAGTLLGAALAIYHTVGTPLVVACMGSSGRHLGVNGVWGNAGVATASLGTAVLMGFGGWRAAFIVPGLLALALGMLSLRLQGPPAAPREPVDPVRSATGAGSRRAFGVLALSALMGGLLFQALTFALPRLLADLAEAGQDGLVGVGMLVAATTLLGALAQFAIGRLAEHLPAGRLFQGLNLVLLAGLALVATGQALAVAAGVAMAMIALFGLFTVEDGMMMAVIPPSWRSRGMGLAYLASFCTAGAALPLVAWSREAGGGGFGLLALLLLGLAAVTFLAGLFLPARLTGPAGILRQDGAQPLTDGAKVAT
ncbi:MFS transporter [Geminicoccus roseus]|uniref:MFS transporter n=1 Tax=Geminicoccus roseus TaxID=404900 RepID=UPI0003FA3A65|nr:MFS transporter [Geminicoccus roseus]